MAVTSKVLIQPKQAESAQTTQYTAVNCTAYIDKFTVTNTTSANVQFTVNLVPASGAPAGSNLILNQRSIAPKETYTCPELSGQILAPGDAISTVASSAASLTIRASGRELT